MSSSVFIFNQYYIDLLKKIKVNSKELTLECNIARNILKAIKTNYSTLDKSSNEYVNYIKSNISEDVWKTFINLEDDKFKEWIDTNKDINIFIDITLGDIYNILNDDYLCLNYFSVFYIFKEELESETIAELVKILKSITDALIDEETVEDENIRIILQRLKDERLKTMKDKPSGIDMKGLEDTNLGKLAKEILDDIDIPKLKKSIDNSGDVFKAIGDPDSGFGDVISNVSKKMANKISSGELNKDNMIQDAMKFASMMPGLFNSGGSGGNNQNNGGGMPDLSSMSGMMNAMSAMSSMMGNNGNNGNNSSNNGGKKKKQDDFDDMNNMFKNMASSMANNKGGKKSRGTIDQSSIKKLQKMKKLKNKLERMKREKEENEEGSNIRPEEND